MDEYIELEKLVLVLRTRLQRLRKDSGEYDVYANGYEECVSRVEDFLAADVAPVRHGRWEYNAQTMHTQSLMRCSICGWWTLDPSVDGVYKYCPNCGARMDGGAENAAD